MLDSHEASLKVCPVLNPATVLPSESTEELILSCAETIQQVHVHFSRTQLQDEPLESPDVEWLTEARSFRKEGIRKAGPTTVGLTQVLEVQALPSKTSTQKAELTHICFSHATCTCSNLGRGLLTAKNSPIKYGKEETLTLL